MLPVLWAGSAGVPVVGGALEDHERAGFHAGGGVLRVAKHREIVAFLALGAGLHGGGGGAGQVHMAAVQYGVA